MRRISTQLSGTVLALTMGASMGLVAGTAGANDAVVMAVPSFLTGAGAPAFGVPSRNGAELLINAINKGKVPAPYNSKGLAGRQIKAIFYDESGGSTKQVAELRNKVQKQGADVVVGYISSGTCAAIAPVAEELKVFTVLPVCGTPRIFEDIIPNAKYVFRTMMHATADGVAEAHYVKAKMPNVKSYTGINQNYAWGQDSWRDFDLAMKVLMPHTTASDKAQWPKIFAGQYGTEISALMLAKENLVHSSFWGGDLEALIFQGSARGLFRKKTLLFSVAASSIYRLGKKFPLGVIVGARGPYGVYAKNIDTPINNWFRAAYIDRYNTPPTGGAYQFAQGVLAAKYAYDTAASANGGKFPSKDQVVAALTGATFEGVTTTVKMALGNGHQSMTDYMLGKSAWDKENGEPKIVDIMTFKGTCLLPPNGVKGVDWLKGGMKGANC